jgi:hypothetical protein
MTTLPPPNIFNSGTTPSGGPDEAAASSRSHAPGAAADVQSSCGSTESRRAETHHTASLDKCKGPHSVGVASDPQEAIDCIGEIFIGAAKLEPVEMWFENTAYPREDELLYEVLLAMDDPHAPDLIEMPYGLWEEFDPPPLFLQRTG